jgi:hypothetical protein
MRSYLSIASLRMARREHRGQSIDPFSSPHGRKSHPT